MAGAELTPRPARSFGRRLTAAFTERLAYKAAALFFALVLWLVVSGEEPSEAMVAVRFSPELDSTLARGDGRPVIRALIVGRKRELLKLYGTQPHLHRTFGSQTSDSVRVELRPGDIELPAGVDAVVREVQPRVVTLHFAPRVVGQSSAADFSGERTPP